MSAETKEIARNIVEKVIRKNIQKLEQQGCSTTKLLLNTYWNEFRLKVIPEISNRLEGEIKGYAIEKCKQQRIKCANNAKVKSKNTSSEYQRFRFKKVVDKESIINAPEPKFE